MTVSCQLSCGHSCCLVPPLNPPQPFFFSSSSFSAFFTILSIPILHLSLSQSHSSHSQSHSCKYPILISSRTYLHNRVSEMARRGKYPASIFLSEGERVEERKKLENLSTTVKTISQCRNQSSKTVVWEASFQRKVVGMELQHEQRVQQLYPNNGRNKPLSKLPVGSEFHINTLHLAGLSSQSRKVGLPSLGPPSLQMLEELAKCWTTLVL